MRQNRVHLMPPMSNFYARICVKATPSSNSRRSQKHRMTIVKFQKFWDKYIRVPYLPVQIWEYA